MNSQHCFLHLDVLHRDLYYLTRFKMDDQHETYKLWRIRKTVMQVS